MQTSNLTTSPRSMARDRLSDLPPLEIPAAEPLALRRRGQPEIEMEL